MLAAEARRFTVTSSELVQGINRILRYVTDGANATLLELRAHFSLPAGWTVTAAVPFSSSRKWSAASFDGRGTWVLGAPEMVLPGIDSGNDVAARADVIAAGGNRALLVAHSAAGLSGPHLPPDLRAAALISFEERIRPDAAATLRYFTDQGVGVRVISGDNPKTGWRGRPPRRAARRRRAVRRPGAARGQRAIGPPHRGADGLRPGHSPAETSHGGRSQNPRPCGGHDRRRCQ
jgi:hypothetical protein